MVPETVGALFAFLGLIAPGVVFELRRERRRPSLEETAFREASRTALTSLLFSGAAGLVVALIGGAREGAVADVPAWIRDGKAYAANHLGLLIWTGALWLMLSCGAAFAADRWLAHRSSGGNIISGSIWFQVFRQRRPANTTPWVHMALADESQVWGYLGDYTPDQNLDNRELTVVGPKLQMRVKGSNVNEVLDAWKSISVRGADIRWMKVTYVADAEPATSAPQARGLLARTRERAKAKSAENGAQPGGPARS